VVQTMSKQVNIDGRMRNRVSHGVSGVFGLGISGIERHDTLLYYVACPSGVLGALLADHIAIPELGARLIVFLILTTQLAVHCPRCE
jgi:hypothetical protein